MSWFEAVHDYSSQDERVIDFKKGDRVYIVQQNGGWWEGKLEGKRGYFPSTFLRPVEDNDDGADEATPPTVPSAQQPSTGPSKEAIQISSSGGASVKPAGGSSALSGSSSALSNSSKKKKNGENSAGGGGGDGALGTDSVDGDKKKQGEEEGSGSETAGEGSPFADLEAAVHPAILLQQERMRSSGAAGQQQQHTGSSGGTSATHDEAMETDSDDEPFFRRVWEVEEGLEDHPNHQHATTTTTTTTDTGHHTTSPHGESSFDGFHTDGTRIVMALSDSTRVPEWSATEGDFAFQFGLLVVVTQEATGNGCWTGYVLDAPHITLQAQNNPLFWQTVSFLQTDGDVQGVRMSTTHALNVMDTSFVGEASVNLGAGTENTKLLVLKHGSDKTTSKARSASRAMMKDGTKQSQTTTTGPSGGEDSVRGGSSRQGSSSSSNNSNNNKVRAVALADYKATEKNMVDLIKGQEVIVLKQEKSGWWLGRTADGIKGYFPATYVKKLEPTDGGGGGGGGGDGDYNSSGDLRSAEASMGSEGSSSGVGSDEDEAISSSSSSSTTTTTGSGAPSASSSSSSSSSGASTSSANGGVSFAAGGSDANDDDDDDDDDDRYAKRSLSSVGRRKVRKDVDDEDDEDDDRHGSPLKRSVSTGMNRNRLNAGGKAKRVFDISFDPWKMGAADIKEAKREGFMTKTKRGKAGLTSWKKRWFCLKEQYLIYYKNKSDKSPTGVISLNGANTNIPNDKKKAYFELTTTENITYMLGCDNKELCEAWVADLNQTLADLMA